MMSRLSAYRRKNRRGSAFVEGALVLTVVIFTLLGIVDLGQVLIVQQALVERVRQGARWAVVNPFDATKIANVVMYNTPSPSGSAQPLFGLTTSMVSASQYAANTPEWRIIVQIHDYPFHFFSPWLKGDYTARPIMVDVSGESQGATN
jgi:hypothetical protein